MSSHLHQPGQTASGIASAAERFLAASGLAHLPGPDPGTLREIYRAFTVLPYENVSKILKSRSTDGDRHVAPAFRTPEEVLEGWLSQRLGGTCFSLTHCLYTLLRHCGFSAYRVLGDMHHGRNIHCAVMVTLDGDQYLCDAGYLLPEPLRLAPGGRRELDGPVYRYRLVAEPGTPPGYSLYSLTPSGVERWRYRIHDRPADNAAFEYHWARSFTLPLNDQLILGRNAGEEQIYVHKDNLRITTSGGRKNRNLKKSIGTSVQELFGIDPGLVERAYEITEPFKKAVRGGR
ncbi:MAG: arylamine N-acetyltransferase [Candidatus Glassbacteria bacterium]